MGSKEVEKEERESKRERGERRGREIGEGEKEREGEAKKERREKEKGERGEGLSIGKRSVSLSTRGACFATTPEVGVACQKRRCVDWSSSRARIIRLHHQHHHYGQSKVTPRTLHTSHGGTLTFPRRQLFPHQARVNFHELASHFLDTNEGVVCVFTELSL
ncbi:hypothetical protein WMY93_003251 [Mugilogobius chulae]|uniref:Uncharacterized protein n=1 Tax=Mugilogobius chulae TaxID=88201 RepID=A0AAW0PWX7_9GOBI